MKKVKGKNKILYIFVLILVAMFASIAGVYAERIIASSNVTYNNSTSGLTSINVQGAIDELYGKYVKCARSFGNFGCFLQSLEASDTVIADDGTKDHNMRYMGAAPNNYVTFAGELWRVIGVFNNVDNGSGIKETRVKIIRAESIGDKQWHTSKVNIWKSASLNAELQSLSYASNSMVENAVWYLGDIGSNLLVAKRTYETERGTTVADGNDPTWTGKVGLMYPSDYGFASSACKDGAKILANYDATDIDCKGTDWLFLGSDLGSDEWLLSPVSSSTIYARPLRKDGRVITASSVTNNNVVRPTVYLKSSVTCKNCNEATAGTKENPFQIS